MKVTSVIQFPLKENEILTESALQSLVGLDVGGKVIRAFRVDGAPWVEIEVAE